MVEGASPRDFFEEAVDFIGESWLREKDEYHQSKNLQRNPPPVVQQYHRGLRDLDYIDDEFEEHFPAVSMPTLELVNLGRYVSTLADANVVSADTFEEIDSDLAARFTGRLRNPDEYEKALYELRTGAIYVSQGYDVSFIQEAEFKTPDILLRAPEKVCIECKRVDSKPGRGQKRGCLNEVLLKKTIN